MSIDKALDTKDIARLDDAIALARKSSREFAGEFQSNEARFIYAGLDLIEAAAIILKAMPGALASAHESIETERVRLSEALRTGHETITALHKIDENAVRKQVINLTSQVLKSLRPEIDNRARLLNERMTMKQVGGLIAFTSAVAIVIFAIGRFSA